MIDYKGLKLPEGERHLQAWMDQDQRLYGGKPAYQLGKYEAALRYTGGRTLAVDVGANIGLWSRMMAQDFAAVIAYEPVAAYAACWQENLRPHPHAHLNRVALGAAAGRVDLAVRTKGSMGDTGVARAEDQAAGLVAIDVALETLDSYALPAVDLIKIDNEGYEFYVVQGARQTILRCRPTVIVEQKPGMGQRYGLRELQAVETLECMGMRVAERISGDYILVW